MQPDHRLESAYQTARETVLRARSTEGPWLGVPVPSITATASAVAALALHQQDRSPPRPHDKFVNDGIAWLVAHQHADGGWAERGPSDGPTTTRCRAAISLAGATESHAEAWRRAAEFVRGRNVSAGQLLADGGRDGFSVPLLAISAAAGLLSWSTVPAQPFERTCVPPRWGFSFRVPVLAADLPAFIAVGLAVQHQSPTWRPVLRWLRRVLRERGVAALEMMQSEDGGFLGNVRVTAEVLACLASADFAKQGAARNAARFLTETASADGSWPEWADQAGLLTPLAVDALGSEKLERQAGLYSWLAKRPVPRRHPLFNEDPGGWGSSEPPSAVPDTWHTAHALLALARTASTVPDEQPHPSPRAIVRCNLADLPEAASCLQQLPRLADLPWDDRRPVRDGLIWLLAAQNDDGGWPLLPSLKPTDVLHESAPEVTAQALRALAAWQTQTEADQLYAEALSAARQANELPGFPLPDLEEAVNAGLAYLATVQDEKGAWQARWPTVPASPVLTTGLVLAAFRDLAALTSEPARLAISWVVAGQNDNGGWGPEPRTPSRVEETACVVRVLPETEPAFQRGLDWLLSRGQAPGEPFGPGPLWPNDPLVRDCFILAALGERSILPPK
jgi:squalene-hopene/tetraprenyl-beta-curcumene cyclase